MKEYIEREVALEILKRNPIGTWRGCPVYSEEIKSAMAEIGDLPAADVAEVVHSKWDGVFQDGACSWSGRCSACGVRNDIPHPLVANYCPNCGAKMDGAK